MISTLPPLHCNHCGNAGAAHVFTKFGYDLVECSDCGLAYIANPPTPKDLADSYQHEANYHDALLDPASSEFATMTRVAKTHMDFVARHAKPGRLLDVGSSTGLFLNEARSAGYSIEGVEFSRGSAEFARSHFGLTVTDGDIHAAAPNPKAWDVITMFDVIEHVPDPTRDMLAAWDMLKPGGLFIVSTPNIDGLFPRLSLKVARALDYWPHPEPPHHLYQFSVRTLSAMLANTGFKVEGERQINIDLAYSFGTLATLAKMPKRLAYAAVFAPLAKLGPRIGQGDWFYLAARKG